MKIQTKFDIGETVRRKGTHDLGEVTEIAIEIDEDLKPLITYQVRHSAYDNPHVGTDFGGGGFESEFEKTELNAYKDI